MRQGKTVGDFGEKEICGKPPIEGLVPPFKIPRSAGIPTD
jgi:hypothetical protein